MNKNETKPLTKDEISILHCITKGRQSMGRGMVSEIVRGSHSVRVFSRRLYQNSAFGALKGQTAESVDKIINDLISREMLEETPDEYPRLFLTKSAKETLRTHVDEG